MIDDHGHDGNHINGIIDLTDNGLWYYCHNTLPATAYQLFLQIVLFFKTPTSSLTRYLRATGQKTNGEEEALYMCVQ